MTAHYYLYYHDEEFVAIGNICGCFKYVDDIS